MYVLAFDDKLLLQKLRDYLLRTLVLLSIVLAAGSCSLTNEDISTDPSFQLRFSADTVFFDTIFSEIPSITRRLRVYNDNNAAVSIASIALADPNSTYELTINGRQGKRFSNTKLLSNDSLLILVDALIEDRDNTLPYVIEDRLEFSTNGNNQEVSIFSWGQDVNYLRDSVLTCNTTWTAGKPYVIFNSALVDSLCTLTIEPGTRIYSHIGSQLFVKGTIQANGSREDRIIFSNDRFDGDYQTFPGQWGGLTFLPGSKNNFISFTDIRNADIGIWLGTPDEDAISDLILENTIIENMANSGLLAFTSDLEMNNCLVNNSGDVLLGLLAGGNYILNHNTIANYGFGVFKSQPAFYATDQLDLSDGSLIADDLNLIMNNCIIWGTTAEEIVLSNETANDFVVSTSNNLLRTTDDIFNGFDNILNEDPGFLDPAEFIYQLNEGSPAIKAGKDFGFLIDLPGNPRTDPPDIGAYEKQQ